LLMPSQGYVLFPFPSFVTDREQELGLPFIIVSAPSIVSGMSGESEKTLRDTFEEAKVFFKLYSP
jgi:SpoVK/Ycf46/Vps4 family AAA+-type ATPase